MVDTRANEDSGFVFTPVNRLWSTQESGLVQKKMEVRRQVGICKRLKGTRRRWGKMTPKNGIGLKEARKVMEVPTGTPYHRSQASKMGVRNVDLR